MHPSAMQITSRKRMSPSANDGDGECSATANTPCDPPVKQSKLEVATITTTKKVNALIFDYIIENVQPFSLVENASFRKLIQGISGGKTPMCRKTLMHWTEKSFQSMKKSLVEELQGIETVCTTADIWTSHHRSYLGMTCHWIEQETLERKSAALACTRVRGRHTYDVLAEKISEIHAEFNIQGKVCSTITDNGSNFVKAFQKFGNPEEHTFHDYTDGVQFADISAILQDNSQQELNFFLPPHHRCAAHTLNLIATRDLEKAASQDVSRKLYRSALSKCAAIWNKAHRSPIAAEVLEDIANMRCIVPSVTRWSSEYRAIEKIVSLTEAQLIEVCDRVSVAKLHPQETAFLKEYTAVLKPLAYAIDLLQGEKNCFLGFIIPTIIGLKAKLTEKISQVQFSANIISTLIKSIDTRFKEVLDSHDARMAASTIPKFRPWWLPADERENMRRIMIQEAALLDIVPSAELTTTENGQMSGDMDDNFFSFENTQIASTKAENEIRNYLQDPCKTLDALKLYPIVKSLFLKYNTTLPSSAPVERLFSQGGLIFTPLRGSMTDEHFEHTLLLRYNRPYWAQVGE